MICAQTTSTTTGRMKPLHRCTVAPSGVMDGSMDDFGFRISDRCGPFTPSRARSPINAKSLRSQGWECRKRPSGSGKLARSRCNQVGARSVHTPMAGWPAGALVPSSPKVRLGLAHPPAYAHGSPRPPSPAWCLCRDVRLEVRSKK